MSDFQGKNFDFEYDNVITDRILNGISQTGISNKIEYNEFGNPINTKISNVRINKDLMDTQYYIRHKGTNKYINLNFNTKTVKLTEETCSTISWEIIKEDNYYKVKQPQSNGYLTAKDNAIKTTYYNNDLILFELTKQDNGSYLIKSKPTGKYITVENDTIVLSDLIEDSYTQQFYFEDTYTDLFIENTAEYTEDGKYIKRTKDTLGNTTTYDIENTSGLK